MLYHAVVQHAVWQRCSAGVLAVQVLADHLNMRLLTHLLGRLHAKADVASVKKGMQRSEQGINNEQNT